MWSIFNFGGPNHISGTTETIVTYTGRPYFELLSFRWHIILKRCLVMIMWHIVNFVTWAWVDHYSHWHCTSLCTMHSTKQKPLNAIELTDWCSKSVHSMWHKLSSWSSQWTFFYKSQSIVTTQSIMGSTMPPLTESKENAILLCIIYKVLWAHLNIGWPLATPYHIV